LTEQAVPATRWLLSGIVQGVGFRPFVYRLAHQYGLRGWVRNCSGQVEILAAGPAGQLQAFGSDLLARAPAIARPQLAAKETLQRTVPAGFRILASEAGDDPDIHVPPDYFVCQDCLAELNDPADRRYRYPFINCTQCGPRYTLIRSLPYDRPNTSMARFRLCDQCRGEYSNALDRRFHAEPVACPVCGPQLHFRAAGQDIRDNQAALAACVQALRQGQVVAVKGVGGYHLLCDAASSAALRQLRACKPRPHKPLAVMFPDHAELALLRQRLQLDVASECLLRSPERPIVLLERLPEDDWLPDIAPGLNEIGVMLPYSPLHHLLLDAFAAPVVATSANVSGEPVFTAQVMVEQRLDKVAQAFLHHDRPIVRPADDPLYRSIAGRLQPVRLGRGNAPLELVLPFALRQPVLAVGGHTKNTLCLAWESRAVVSPHIGDMGTVRSLEVFRQVARDLQHLYGIKAQQLVCDAHPGYATARWAEQKGLPLARVLHHMAHASALVGEQGQCRADALVFTWDGVGYGADGTLWGGEALYGRPGHWQRVASMRPFYLPGGEKAGREPWRSALALAWELGNDRLAQQLIGQLGPGFAPPGATSLLYQAWQKRLNAPQTSAVGRLFDAAAALSGVCLQASFEGQGPMWLEALASGTAEPIDLPLTEQPGGLLVTDWSPLVEYMSDSRRPRARRAAVFHASMAEVLLQQALGIRARCAVDRVGLCGGVFQNRLLAQACAERLEANGFKVLLAHRLPVNDAGLSFGQVMEYGSAT
jgi:hydrogenase maturation protein HypF